MVRHTVDLGADSFVTRVQQEGIVVIDFWAAWCAPCRAFAPIFEAAAAKHPDLVWGKVDTEAEPELSSALAIRSIPTLMVFRDGILVFSQPGMLPGPALEQLVTQVRALDMDDVRRRVTKQQSEAARVG